jgi:SWI/SNF-related matrix-associated actin-dependent regulator 1 of chromatin subfamily A
MTTLFKHQKEGVVFLRRTKEEVLDLPEKIISQQMCELTPDQQGEYDEAWNLYLNWIESHPDAERDIQNIKDAQQLIELGKLKQVCSRAKVKRIAEDIENAVEQDEKVIVFTQYKETINKLRFEMDSRNIGAVELTGETKMQERQDAVDAFQNDPMIKVFIANIKAGGVGINLTAASIVIFVDMDWSPEIHNQAMDRAHRIGQKGTVNVYYYIVKDTVEEQIVELLSQKKDIINQVV